MVCSPRPCGSGMRNTHCRPPKGGLFVRRTTPRPADTKALNVQHACFYSAVASVLHMWGKRKGNFPALDGPAPFLV